MCVIAMCVLKRERERERESETEREAPSLAWSAARQLGNRTGRNSVAETVVPGPQRTGESGSSSVGVLVVVLVIKNVVLRFNLLKRSF